MLDEKTWNCIRENKRVRELAPRWAKPIFELTFENLQKMPPPLNPPENEVTFRPVLELNETTSSYLNFLKSQIELKPRGEEWAAVLQARLLALAPYESKPLYHFSMINKFSGVVESLSAYLEPGSFTLVHLECH